jgi:uncharacterized membrane protein
MTKGRLEAFSDAIIAIVMTIMVLELRPPDGTGLAALAALTPKFVTYTLSFVYLAIYWNNHHHLFQAVQKVDGRVLWANMFLLFWLSMVPFVTAWAGDHATAPVPVAAYGVVLLLAAIAYYLLARALLAVHDQDSPLARAIEGGAKEKLSLALYAAAVPATFLTTWLGWAAYFAVAAIWLIPDSRIERTLRQ